MVRRSIKYVSEAIRTSAHTTINLGKGTNKPINHLHTINLLPFLPGNFVEYALNHPKVRDVWREYTEHEFVKKLGDGTLEPERFRWYLIQDYLFLVGNFQVGNEAMLVLEIHVWLTSFP